jgi:hypothetical protein
MAIARPIDLPLNPQKIFSSSLNRQLFHATLKQHFGNLRPFLRQNTQPVGHLSSSFHPFELE